MKYNNQVVDRTDGHLVHLDGLNFSRAWCLYNFARRLLTSGQDTETAARLVAVGDTHIRLAERPHTRAANEDFTIMEKAPTRAFS